jgi:hypothetical protein
MLNLITKKTGLRATIIGIVLAIVGFIGLMLNVFNVYDKASSCLGASTCKLSNNQIIAHLGITTLFIGLIATATGIIIIISSSKQHR